VSWRLSLIAATAAALALIAGAAAGGAVDRDLATLKAPVIHESFTPLPCTGKPKARDTLQQEGCAEQQILGTDARIDTLAGSIFARLSDRASKGRFITAQKLWLSYRHADCLSRADVFEGGSQAPVVAAQCAAARNEERIKDLQSFLAALSGAQ